jgi:hypothetical protein
VLGEGNMWRVSRVVCDQYYMLVCTTAIRTTAIRYDKC